jgi:hypothetical protein
MRQVEIHSPRTTLRTPIFLLGQNSRGQWVVQDERHLRGGVFINRADALRFAMFENPAAGRRHGSWDSRTRHGGKEPSRCL